VNEIGVGIYSGVSDEQMVIIVYVTVFAYRADISPITIVTTSSIETTLNQNSSTHTFSSTSYKTTTSHTIYTGILSTVISTSTSHLSSTSATSTQTDTTDFTTLSTTVENPSTNSTDMTSFQIISNSTISDFLFNLEEKTITFTVTGSQDTKGYCNATIPKIVIDGTPIVSVNGTIIEITIWDDSINYYTYFTYNHSSQKVTITGSNEIPELIHMPMILVITFFFIALLTYTKRRKRS
jgi:hypothetical protein